MVIWKIICDKNYRYLYLIIPLIIFGLILTSSSVFTKNYSVDSCSSVFEKIEVTTLDLLNSDSELSLFASALDVANILGTLEDGVSVLVFAPTNHGLRDQGSAFLLQQDLLTENNEARLIFQVGSHIVENPPSHITSGSYRNARTSVQTISGITIPIRLIASEIVVGHDAFVTKMVKTTDGIVLIY